MKIDYANKFLNEDRKHLNLDRIKILDKNFIRIESPQLLAAFIGYLKYQHRKIGRIYFRGERDYYLNTIPALYRGVITNDIIIKRTNAYNELVNSIPTLFKGYRFKRENINPLLQHYGIKTNWIDLVDNLYVAIWFSLYKNRNEFGYIKTFCEKNGNSSLIISELREKHSSLSLRLHCQHGISVTKRVRNWKIKNIDFNDYLVSTVEIPNNHSFELIGDIFKKEYMFPSKDIDNTFKLFSSNKMTDKLNEILRKYSLDKDDLGQIE